MLNEKRHLGLCRIEALCAGQSFSLLIFEDYSSVVEGEEVYLLIKESEVALSKSLPLDISISNCIQCTVESINIGEILCESQLVFGEQRISSIITSDSAKRLGLGIGDTVYALIKANEIYLERL